MRLMKPRMLRTVRLMVSELGLGHVQLPATARVLPQLIFASGMYLKRINGVSCCRLRSLRRVSELEINFQCCNNQAIRSGVAVHHAQCSNHREPFSSRSRPRLRQCSVRLATDWVPDCVRANDEPRGVEVGASWLRTSLCNHAADARLILGLHQPGKGEHSFRSAGLPARIIFNQDHKLRLISQYV